MIIGRKEVGPGNASSNLERYPHCRAASSKTNLKSTGMFLEHLRRHAAQRQCIFSQLLLTRHMLTRGSSTARPKSASAARNESDPGNSTTHVLHCLVCMFYGHASFETTALPQAMRRSALWDASCGKIEIMCIAHAGNKLLVSPGTKLHRWWTVEYVSDEWHLQWQKISKDDQSLGMLGDVLFAGAATARRWDCSSPALSSTCPPPWNASTSAPLPSTSAPLSIKLCVIVINLCAMINLCAIVCKDGLQSRILQIQTQCIRFFINICSITQPVLLQKHITVRTATILSTFAWGIVALGVLTYAYFNRGSWEYYAVR